MRFGQYQRYIMMILYSNRQEHHNGLDQSWWFFIPIVGNIAISQLNMHLISQVSCWICTRLQDRLIRLNTSTNLQFYKGPTTFFINSTQYAISQAQVIDGCNTLHHNKNGKAFLAHIIVQREGILQSLSLHIHCTIETYGLDTWHPPTTSPSLSP